MESPNKINVQRYHKSPKVPFFFPIDNEEDSNTADLWRRNGMQSAVTHKMTIKANDIITKIIIIKQQTNNKMLEKVGFYHLLSHLFYI